MDNHETYRHTLKKHLKIILPTLCAGIIIFAFLLFAGRPCFTNGGSYTYYIGKGSKNCKVVNTSSYNPFMRLTLSGVCGEGCEYSNTNLSTILAEYNAEIIFCETLSDSVNYYCRASLPYSITLYGEEINLHICVRADKIKVGSPIIFGGY
jgi:hypothetical protein